MVPHAVTTGSSSRFAESPLWPCSSVLLEQPRPIAPLYDNIRSPATEVYNRFKPGRALKHRTDQTSHDSTVLFHHDAVRRPRLSNPVSPLRLLIFPLLARPHTTANVSEHQDPRGPDEALSMFHQNADLWAVGDPLNRLAAELRTACVMSGLCESPPTSDIHYYFFLDHFVFRLLNSGRG